MEAAHTQIYTSERSLCLAIIQMIVLQLVHGSCARDVVVERDGRPLYALVDKTTSLAIERFTPKVESLAQIKGQDAILGGQCLPLHSCFLPNPAGKRSRFFSDDGQEYHFEQDGRLSDRLVLWRKGATDTPIARFTPLHTSFPAKNGQIIIEQPDLCFDGQTPTFVLDLIMIHYFLFLAERRMKSNEGWQVVEVLGSKKLRICGTLRDMRHE